MSAFVLDASVALAWHFGDERWQGARALAARAAAERTLAPDYLPLEVANGLLRGERMGRTTIAAIDMFLTRMASLAADYHPFDASAVRETLLPLARRVWVEAVRCGLSASGACPCAAAGDVRRAAGRRRRGRRRAGDRSVRRHSFGGTAQLR